MIVIAVAVLQKFEAKRLLISANPGGQDPGATLCGHRPPFTPRPLTHRLDGVCASNSLGVFGVLVRCSSRALWGKEVSKLQRRPGPSTSTVSPEGATCISSRTFVDHSQSKGRISIEMNGIIHAKGPNNPNNSPSAPVRVVLSRVCQVFVILSF